MQKAAKNGNVFCDRNTVEAQPFLTNTDLG